MRLRAGSQWLLPLLLAVAVILGPLLSAGCGGGSSSAPARPTPTPTPTGGGSPTPTPTPTPTAPQSVVGTVLWAPRSRQQTTVGQVSGPASALSVTFVVRGAASGGGDVSFGGDRDPKLGSGGTQDYNSGGQKALPGNYPVNVRFYAQNGGQGTLVGTADTIGTVQADGKLNATFSTYTTITAVDIPADQTLQIGQTKVLNSVNGDNTLLYTPKDEKGNVVAITPGSATLTLVNADSTVPGQASASLQGDSITGLAPQRAIIRVSVDYKNSPDTAVLIRSNAQITVTPDSANLSLLEQQQFTATVANDNPTVNGVTWSVLDGDTAGTIDANGLFKATRKEGTFTVRATSKYDPNVFVDRQVTVQSAVAVTIEPSETQTVSFKGGQFQYRASVSRVPEGQDAGVTWSVDGGDANGTISSDGLYTAPAKSGEFTLIATSKFDTSKSTSVKVIVKSLVNIAITGPDIPKNEVALKTKVNFVAQISGVPNGGDTGYDWSVTGGGSIDQNGVYTAPTAPTPADKPVTVTVTSRFDPGKFASKTFAISNPQTITVQPQSPVNLTIKETQQFQQSVDGTPPGFDDGVVWEVEGGVTNGTITQTGLYTAPATEKQNIKIIVRSKYYTNNPDPYTILVNTVDDTSVVVKPSPVTIAYLGKQQFDKQVINLPVGGDNTVVWSVTDTTFGTIDANTGLFTAKSKPTNGVKKGLIVATSNFSGKKGFADVEIKTGIESFTIKPSGNPLKVPIGARLKFVPDIQGTDEAKNGGVQWQVSGGGSITQDGLYTAPSQRQAGLVTVKATSKYDPNFPAAEVKVKIEAGNPTVVVQ